MDTLTHSLLGAAISDSSFRRRLGPAATPFALAAAALPDIDLLARFFSAHSVWTSHRGYTHSFLPMTLAAPLLGYAGYRLSGRRGTWGGWTLLALLCLFSHTLLDLATSWGTMPLLPFSNARLSWDIAPILDVFMLALTAASFVANRVLRRERVDAFINPLMFPVVHRHPHRQRAGDWIGRVAVALAAAYLLVGWQQNRQTVRTAREELAKRGVTAVEVRALPIMFTYIAWGIAARDAEGTVYNAAHSSYAPRPMRFLAFPTLPRDAVERVLSTPEGGVFAWYSQDMYVAERAAAEAEAAGGTADAGTVTTTLADRRFFTLTHPEAPRFALTLTQDAASGRVLSARRERMGGFRDQGVREEMRRLWELLWTGRGLEEAPGAETGLLH